MVRPTVPLTRCCKTQQVRCVQANISEWGISALTTVSIARCSTEIMNRGWAAVTWKCHSALQAWAPGVTWMYVLIDTRFRVLKVLKVLLFLSLMLKVLKVLKVLLFHSLMLKVLKVLKVLLFLSLSDA